MAPPPPPRRVAAAASHPGRHRDRWPDQAAPECSEVVAQRQRLRWTASPAWRRRSRPRQPPRLTRRRCRGPGPSCAAADPQTPGWNRARKPPPDSGPRRARRPPPNRRKLLASPTPASARQRHRHPLNTASAPPMSRSSRCASTLGRGASPPALGRRRQSSPSCERRFQLAPPQTWTRRQSLALATQAALVCAPQLPPCLVPPAWTRTARLGTHAFRLMAPPLLLADARRQPEVLCF